MHVLYLFSSACNQRKETLYFKFLLGDLLRFAKKSAEYDEVALVLKTVVDMEADIIDFGYENIIYVTARVRTASPVVPIEVVWEILFHRTRKVATRLRRVTHTPLDMPVCVSFPFNGDFEDIQRICKECSTDPDRTVNSVEYETLQELRSIVHTESMEVE